MEQENQPPQVPEPPKTPLPQAQDLQEPPKPPSPPLQAPLPQAQAPLEQTPKEQPLQLSLQPQQTDLNVQRLEMLIAMFKSRNMELLEENNRLRSELETNKQHLLLVQNGGNDAQLLSKILKEMTEMAMGRTPETRAHVTIFSATDAREPDVSSLSQLVSEEPKRGEVKSKCAEFAVELENMPKLPGNVMVETVGVPASSLPQTIVPCIYSN